MAGTRVTANAVRWLGLLVTLSCGLEGPTAVRPVPAVFDRIATACRSFEQASIPFAFVEFRPEWGDHEVVLGSAVLDSRGVVAADVSGSRRFRWVREETAWPFGYEPSWTFTYEGRGQRAGTVSMNAARAGAMLDMVWAECREGFSNSVWLPDEPPTTQSGRQDGWESGRYQVHSARLVLPEAERPPYDLWVSIRGSGSEGSWGNVPEEVRILWISDSGVVRDLRLSEPDWTAIVPEEELARTEAHYFRLPGDLQKWRPPSCASVIG